MKRENKIKITSAFDKIKNIFYNQIEKEEMKIYTQFNSLIFDINYKDLTRIVKILKDNESLKFNQLIDITAVDYPIRSKRFELIYLFLSINQNKRLILKTVIDEDTQVDSLTSIFPCANWYEREIWDLFGISFKNHPDLRRILTDYGFHGFPLRKDFPLSGNVEVKYDIASKKVVYEPTTLTQSFRTFDFESPWIGENSTEKNKDE